MPRKLKPYFRVPYALPHLIVEHGLSKTDIQVYLALLRMIQRNSEAECRIPLRSISRVAGVSVASAHRSTLKLEKKRLILSTRTIEKRGAMVGYFLPMEMTA